MKLLMCFLSAYFFISTVSSQDCGECSRPRVALYDFQMNVARPDSVEEIIKWMDLFWVGIKTRSIVKSGETRGCILWLDGAMINANTLQGGKLKWGQEYCNIPAAGIINTDYILWGSISGSNGSYIAQLVFETGESRETVRTESVSFVAGGEEAAGEQLAAQFGSIMQVIRDFEIYKRDNFNDVAIRDTWTKTSSEEIIVTPEKKTVNVGETINVDISLIDCDGVPLKNRTIHLEATTFEGINLSGPQNGSFDKSTVTTDADGKASAQFTTDGPGVAVVRVSFPHYKPVGRIDAYIGEAYLNVPAESVEFTGIWKFESSITGDTTWTQSFEYASFYSNSHTKEYEGGQFKVKGLLERNYAVPVIKIFDNPLSISVSGNYNFKYDFYDNFTVNTSSGIATSIVIENDYFTEKATLPEGVVSINSYNSEDIPEVDVRSDTERRGTAVTKNYSTDYGWQNDSHSLDRTSGFYMNFSNSNLSDKTVTKVSDAVYTYEYKDESFDVNTATVMDFHGHTLTTESTEEWFIKIKLNNVTTSVELIDNNTPGNYSLSQNYPNPFNPATQIEFSIPERAKVTLEVFNIFGKRVASLVNEEMNKGVYKVDFDASAIPSGIYFYKLAAPNNVISKKMLVL